ncbi:polysaccharide pyruvyl transferase family protein [Salegentibacter flavus]|uniref:Polysaccharide pyruvyl transferase n=1 Tax=Salegentibacter flavus TaxID=287099 RepID=A0A1I4Y403_9FLAO|nr:polysaccharide pyruvyl transferase family protein [Salegentibacter flavus]SFN32812.1 Polysaccharide pyruvyl transferase [Salegentibacter flavus]
MKRNKYIPLFFWSEIKFIFKEKENYGDLLSKYLVEKISGREVKWVHPKKQPWYKWDKSHYLAIGSILPHATKNSIVWGSGIIDREHHVAKADFRAVRGPRTREFLQQLGYDCPPVYGDPALLLPEYFNPQVEKEYKLGIIPHYHDYKKAVELFEDNPDIRVIDLMCMDVEEVTRQIMSCERTLSSSLHGLIVSHAYRIPSLWIEFSDKIFGDGIKYPDYLESVGLSVYEPPFIKESLTTEEWISMFEKYPVLPEKKKVKALQQGLMEACPFLPE